MSAAQGAQADFQQLESGSEPVEEHFPPAMCSRRYLAVEARHCPGKISLHPPAAGFTPVCGKLTKTKTTR